MQEGARLETTPSAAPRALATPAPRLPEVVGSGAVVALATGDRKRLVPLNNAATTPPLRVTLDAVNDFLERYGALHRGAGPFARATADAVDAAVDRIRRFLGCGVDQHLLFCQNTSAAVSLFARMLALEPADVVVISEIEHTSNNLPWHFNTPADVVEVRAFDDGSLDLDHLEEILATYGARLRVVAVTGASNQTGFIPDLARLADRAHSHGALLFVDAAQLAPHRAIDMQATGIDALALSAHKLYAPFGLGVLALPTGMAERVPVDPGGGSIDMISDTGLLWAPPSLRHQTGTWNAVGIVALAASCAALTEAGWDAVGDHERALVARLAGRLPTVPGLRLHVPPSRYAGSDRIGTFPFTLAGIHHALLAAVLEHEHAVEVRAGTICNHRLVRRWMGVDDGRQAALEARISAGDRLASYGIARASVGLHNTAADVDDLIAALERVAVEGPRLAYEPVPAEETYEPAGAR